MADYAQLFRDFEREVAAIHPPPGFVLTHSAPASHAQIQAVQSKLRVQLPEDLFNYLSAANGSVFGEEEIFGTNGLNRWDDLLVLHEWGNGDFTVIPTRDIDGFRMGSVLFANHRPDVLALVAENMASWFVRLKAELVHRGEILHPMDYKTGNYSPTGCYADVLHQLNGIDCEFNR